MDMLLNKEKRCKDALKEVSAGLSFCKAAKKYNLKHSNLTYRAKKINIVSEQTKQVQKAQAQKEKARELRAKGLSLCKIALELKISHSSVKNYCEGISITDKQYQCNLQRLPDKRKKAIEFRNNGMSMGKIAKQLGVAKSSVSKWLKEAGANVLSVNQRKNEIDFLLKKEKENLLSDVVKYRLLGYGFKEIANLMDKKVDFIMSISKLYNFSSDEKEKIEKAVKDRTTHRRHKGELKPVGGLKQGSERSKFGYYKNIYSSSTYELCWIIYNLDMGKDVKRFDGFLECPDKKFKYYPDFIEENNHIIEIKGYEDESVARKTALAERLGYTVTLMKEKDLQHVFEYVDKTYNVNKNNRHTLYDNYKPKFIINCFGCKKDFEVFKLRKKHKDGLPSYCSISCAAVSRHKNKQNK